MKVRRERTSVMEEKAIRLRSEGQEPSCRARDLPRGGPGGLHGRVAVMAFYLELSRDAG